MQDRASQIQIIQRMIDAGESEENIAKVIEKFKTMAGPATAPVPDDVPRSYGGYRGPTGHATSVPTDVALRRLRNAAPAIGAGLAVAVTGGTAAVPMMTAAGLGGVAGQAVKDAPDATMPMADRLWNMGESGLLQAAVQGTGSLTTSLAPKLAQGARNLWNRAAKITEPVAKKTQTMRSGGTLQQGKDEIAETVLSEGAGTIRQANAEALGNRLSQIDDAVDEIVANSKGMVSRQELRDALKAKYLSITPGTQAAEVERAALEKSFKLLSKMPPKMTVAKAQEIKRDIYRTYEKTFAADASEAATAMADKTTAKALRAGVAREEPAVAPLNQEMSRLIPAKAAMDKAVSRTSNHNIAGLTQVMAGMVPNKTTVIAALLNHPKVASFTAQQLYNAASRLPKDARTAGNIIRMAETLLIAGRND